MDKLAHLESIIAAYRSAAVAYSGGADSAFLADVAHEVLGERMVAVTAVSASLDPGERDSARELARERGWRHVEIHTRELDRQEYRKNDGQRCYYCKDELLTELERHRTRLGVDEMLLGTNVDDLGDYRPGRRAALEHGAKAPLVEAGFTKAEIREASKERGLRTWDKPAAPCLSSRVAYGVEVTPARIRRIARAESFVRSFGFRELRVRDLGGRARIEVPLGDIARLERHRDTVRARLEQLGFDDVSIDENGLRSGSLNVALGMPARRPS